MDAQQKLLDDAINLIDREWETYGEAYRLYKNDKNYAIPWMLGFDHVLNYLDNNPQLSNPPLSRRERRRLAKVKERWKLKQRKRKYA